MKQARVQYVMHGTNVVRWNKWMSYYLDLGGHRVYTLYY